MISRRPDAILHAQFYCEDGIWFSQAYIQGAIKALSIPYGGYLVTFQRIIAGFSLLVPIAHAPLVMNLGAMFVQIAPVNLLCSARCACFGTLPMRFLMSLTYLALPNAEEIHANLTNSQWHLALIAALPILASTPATRPGRIADQFVLLIAGLTGPFCIVLFPIAVAMWYLRPNRWRLLSTAAVAMCALVQGYFLFVATQASRVKMPLGASFPLFIHFLSNHIFLPAVLGIADYGSHLSLGLETALSCAGILIVVYGFLYSGVERRLFILFSALVFAASLRSSLVSLTLPQWPVMDSTSGARYWFFPTLAFVWALLWCANLRNRDKFHLPALACSALMTIGIARNWVFAPLPDQNFASQAERFCSLPRNYGFSFRIAPEGWLMMLPKDPTVCTVLPFGYLDGPSENTRITEPVTVRGWVSASHPVRDIAITVDGSLVKSVRPAMRRPDVDRLYPKSSVIDKGWQASLDLSGFTAGVHKIQTYAALENGCSMEIGSSSIVKP